MDKQDRQGVRTPADLERKYNFDKRFSEIMGIATDARDSVDKVESTLRNEIENKVTSITRDTESIIMSALAEYVKTGDFETYKKTASAEFSIMANEISMSVSQMVGECVKTEDFETYKREASAEIDMKADEISTSVSEIVSEVEKKTIVSNVAQFYQSTSSADLSGGTWSNTQPAWEEGKYIWMRTLVTYGDGTTSYTPSDQGVCITGNTGADGTNGERGEQGAAGKTSYFHIKYSDDGSTFTANNGDDLGAWIGTLVDFNEEASTNFSDYTWKKFTEDVDEELENIRTTIREQNTAITENCQQIVISALESYVEKDAFEEYREQAQSDLSVMADRVSISVSEALKQTIKNGDEELLAMYNELRMNYDFTADGQYIGKKDSDTMLRLVNDMMQILVSGVAATTVDKSGLTAEQANIKTLHMGDYTLALGNDNHLMLT